MWPRTLTLTCTRAPAAYKSKVERVLARMDRDGDGKLSTEELAAAIEDIIKCVCACVCVRDCACVCVHVCVVAVQVCVSLAHCCAGT